MNTISYKAKQFFVFAAKLLIVVGAFYFIYSKLVAKANFDWSLLWQTTQKNSIFFVVFLLFLSFANRFLEILKWQNLVSVIEKISVSAASKQVLAALTAGIFTPNGIGEYAGKAFYYEKSKTKTILFLNLVCNGIQMVISVLLGIIGLLVMGYYQFAAFFIAAILALFGVFLLFKNTSIYGYSIEKLLAKILAIPKKVQAKNIFLAILRYWIFSNQYYFLFLFFGVELSYLTIYFTVTCIYFLSSSLPSFQFLDFAVKGSVAIYFFEKLGVASVTVIFVTTLMWFLNVVIPVVLGSYFVVTFKPEATNKIKI